MSESKPPYWSSQRLFQSFSINAKAAAIEFVGTTFFFLLGLGGIQAATGESLQSGSTIEHTLYIATSMGFSTASSTQISHWRSSSLAPSVPSDLSCLYRLDGHLVGVIAASAIVYGLTPGPLHTAFFTSAHGYAVNARTKREFSAKKAI